MIQLHLSGLFLAISTGIFMACRRKRYAIKPIVIGAIVGLLPVVPYILYQLRSSPLCPDCVSLYTYSRLPKELDLAHLWRVLQITSGLHFQYLMGEAYATFQDNFFVSLAIFSFSFSPFLILYGAYRSSQTSLRQGYYIWLAVSVPVLYVLTRTASYIHYYIILLPVLCILEAQGMMSIAVFLGRRLSYLGLGSLAVILMLRVVFWGSFLGVLDEYSFLPGDYGPAYRTVITSQE